MVIGFKMFFIPWRIFMAFGVKNLHKNSEFGDEPLECICPTITKLSAAVPPHAD